MNLIPLMAPLLALQGLPRVGRVPEHRGVGQELVLQGVQATREAPAGVPEVQYREPVGVEGPATGVRQEPLLLQPCVVDDPW